MYPQKLFRNFQLTFLFCFSLFFSAFLWTGCGPDETKKACDSDSTCSKKQICVEGDCVEGCRKSDDCSPGEVCRENTCTKQKCTPGTRKACYTADEKTKSVGLCKAGFQVCNKSGEDWSGCYNQFIPHNEICDGADNNCNGQVDEGLTCQCKVGEKRVCYNGPDGTLKVGLCRSGIQYCDNNNTWGKCHEQVKPEPEVCDQADNNCNGLVDEIGNCECKPGESRVCYTGPDGTANVGSCKKGKQSCGENSQWGACIGQIKPTLEEEQPCNGKDDDCDGVIDNRSGSKEKLTDFCYSGPEDTRNVGPCKDGIKTCLEGKWGPCKPGKNEDYSHTLPKKEDCNAKDDDCNGQIDDSIETEPCYSGTVGCKKNKNNSYSCRGRCAIGERTCSDGKWSACIKEVLPADKEDCSNNLDDDCDGAVNEDCNCTDATKQTCYAGPDGTANVGECRSGTQLCRNNKLEACAGSIVPNPEICDGKDNDCNGKIDDIAKLGEACLDITRKGECQAGKVGCEGTKQVCVQTHKAVLETCDGKDNDCNGKVDDIQALGQYCVTGKGKGKCQDGKWTCLNDKKTCQPTVSPTTEVCNGLDDDCDGKVDNVLGICILNGLHGRCAQGNYYCTNGASGWEKKCRQINIKNLEVCNGEDDDCDGVIDNISDKDQSCVDLSRQGSCQQGRWGCFENKKTCLPAYSRTTEVCNGLDDDCDGTPDNILGTCTKEGTSGFGACLVGSYRCKYDDKQSKYVRFCHVTATKQTEVCNNLDDDCDGVIDNISDLGTDCTLGNLLGECRKGKIACEDKKKICKQVYDTVGKVETCNGLDDDCDGVIDESLERKCQNACNFGKETCNYGKWINCNAPPVAKEVCNKKDDDCNGHVDDLADECTVTGKQGPCGKGHKSCDEQGKEFCKAKAAPTTEVCDGIDNDCNGKIDDGFPDTGKLCCLPGGNGALGYVLCQNGKQACYQPPHVDNLNVSNEIWLPPGTFRMGPDSNDKAPQKHEHPQHEVTLTRPFAIQKFETTVEDFQALMGYTPAGIDTACSKGKCPVGSVTWHEAAAYANLLSKKFKLETCYVCTPEEKSASAVDDTRTCKLKVQFENDYSFCKGFRLPTEAEWEYAYRAKTKTPYYQKSYCSNSYGYCYNANVDLGKNMKDRLNKNYHNYAWYYHNQGKKTHIVGGRLPNLWSLYDMAGNVWEWTYDIYGPYTSSAKTDPKGQHSGHLRVFRGGSANSYLGYLRASARSSGRHEGTLYRNKFVGFRLVRSLHQEPLKDAYQTCTK